MKDYIKLLVIKCDTYYSDILKEYNLSSKEDAEKIIRKYSKRNNIVCLLIDMCKEVGIAPLFYCH